MLFKHFYTRSGSSYSKASIYLKSIKTVWGEVNLLWSCKMSTCNFTKKTLSHILSFIYFSFIFSEYITISSSEGALKVWEHNFFLKIQAESSVTCNLSVRLWFIQINFLHPELWHLTFSWIQFLSNKLEFFVSCNNIKIKRTFSFLLWILICFDMYFSIKK